MKKTRSLKFGFAVIPIYLLLALGCAKEAKKDSGETDFTSPAEKISATTDEETLLSKYSTGQNLLAYKKQLSDRGYKFDYQLLPQAKISAITGHSGGGYSMKDKSIIIYLAQEFDINTRAHIIAHEISHIKDDLETTESLKDSPKVESAAADFVKSWKKSGKKIDAKSVDQKTMSYVLNTVFCAEARAYSINKTLIKQGLTANSIEKISSLSKFIDKNYIQQFGTSYKEKAPDILNWCLNFTDMSAIQSELLKQLAD